RKRRDRVPSFPRHGADREPVLRAAARLMSSVARFAGNSSNARPMTALCGLTRIRLAINATERTGPMFEQNNWLGTGISGAASVSAALVAARSLVLMSAASLG